MNAVKSQAGVVVMIRDVIFVRRERRKDARSVGADLRTNAAEIWLNSARTNNTKWRVDDGICTHCLDARSWPTIYVQLTVTLVAQPHISISQNDNISCGIAISPNEKR